MITIHHWDESIARAAALAAFARIEELNLILSDYLPDSEVNRLCDRAGQGPQQVSGELFTILERSAEISRLSGGAFDVAHGALYHLWREARRTGEWPADEEIHRARESGGMEHVRLNVRARTVEIRSPGLRIDFGGIGKGYAAEEARRVLFDHDCRYSLIDFGGDIVANYAPPGRDGWRVQVHSESHGQRVITIALRAAATSGSTEQFIERGGRKYSHIIDPRTGYPVADAPAVTVLAPDGALADALASAITVLGEVEGRRLAQRFGRDVEVVFEE